jgi:AcrR family transcriptional regulator
MTTAGNKSLKTKETFWHLICFQSLLFLNLQEFLESIMDDKLIKILEESKRIFMNYGIRSISMDDISRELGMSKKTLYQFVENKADLVHKMLCYEHEQGKQAFQKIIRENENAIDQLLMVSLMISKKMSEVTPSYNHDLKKYFAASTRSNVEQQKENIAMRVRENIELGIKQGLYRDDLNPELVAQLYVQKISGIMSQENVLSTQYPFTEIFKTMFENHIRGISNENGIKYFEKKIKTFNIKL